MTRYDSKGKRSRKKRRGKDEKKKGKESKKGKRIDRHEVLKGVVRAERLKSPSDYIHEADSVIRNHFCRSEGSEEHEKT